MQDRKCLSLFKHRSVRRDGLHPSYDIINNIIIKSRDKMIYSSSSDKTEIKTSKDHPNTPQSPTHKHNV